MFDSTSFVPRPSELDETSDDYINPGVFALDFADFLVEGLKAEGVKIKFRCQEDWGHWMEVDHDGGFTLAIGCSNIEGEMAHRFSLEPRKPYIRKFFKKLHVEPQVEQLKETILLILRNSGKAENIRSLA
ncbi:hypothetical protein [Roseobacter sp. CCS2]|uniref:hypothetical protein n=1 Tax=Roseobacter sp. CCS2 TaxID=391593 RepID=UPI001E59D545|nr:hypothetical protein [Roseobacter sp. CCS2]